MSAEPAPNPPSCRINSRLGTGETRVENPTRVHVEHILPQNPRATVLTESRVSMEEAAQLVSRIGNLTLLSGRKNREASNKPFSDKRANYAASELTMIQQLTVYDRWSKDQIEARFTKLAAMAAEVYPHPISIIS